MVDNSIQESYDMKSPMKKSIKKKKKMSEN